MFIKAQKISCKMACCIIITPRESLLIAENDGKTEVSTEFEEWNRDAFHPPLSTFLYFSGFFPHKITGDTNF